MAKETTTEKGCTYIARAFILCNNIIREPKPPRQVIRGTRTFHQVSNNPEIPGRLICKQLACTCNRCIDGGARCANADITQNPVLAKDKVVNLKDVNTASKKAKWGTRKTAADEY